MSYPNDPDDPESWDEDKLLAEYRETLRKLNELSAAFVGAAFRQTPAGRERELLLAIASEAEWVARGWSISRQAAYNCIPDLLTAQRAYREWRDHARSAT